MGWIEYTFPYEIDTSNMKWEWKWILPSIEIKNGFINMVCFSI